ncbi:hypothetical protein GT347_02950 [Xylophilus rhododendri]|uniref:Uncharacterized protein n=1 Tax=Xylophilus rhododendri TaxID=2697032 RepID=A0A857J1A5_9BURK|nr:hypothetical protein [Xylophilus rhododendri]QHI97033.1 hypothetical protein GT347_02950 [Xylophilus rhododendri]
MATYFKLIENPSVSMELTGNGMTVYLQDTARDRRVSIHYNNDHVELLPREPGAHALSAQKLIPTEPYKAAQGKLKVSTQDHPKLDWVGVWTDTWEIHTSTQILSTPATFSVSVGKPAVVKPIAADYPDLTLQFAVFNEPPEDMTRLFCYVDTFAEKDWVYVALSTTIFIEGRRFTFMLNGRYAGHIANDGTLHRLNDHGTGDGFRSVGCSAKPGDKFELLLGDEKGIVVYSTILGISAELQGSKILLKAAESLLASGVDYYFFLDGGHAGRIANNKVDHEWTGGVLKDGARQYFRDGAKLGDVFEVRRGTVQGPVIFSVMLGVLAWLDNGIIYLRLPGKFAMQGAGIYEWQRNGEYSGHLHNGSLYYWGISEKTAETCLFHKYDGVRGEVLELREGGAKGPVIYRTAIGYTSDKSLIGKIAG